MEKLAAKAMVAMVSASLDSEFMGRTTKIISSEEKVNRNFLGIGNNPKELIGFNFISETTHL